jgi:hypothetical protein
MGQVSLERARQAKAEVLRRFGDMAGLVGVGITKIGGEYAVKVNLARRSTRAKSLPDDIDGVAVQVEVVGQPRKLAPH